jgi:hypothetical protein
VNFSDVVAVGWWGGQSAGYNFTALQADEKRPGTSGPEKTGPAVNAIEIYLV